MKTKLSLLAVAAALLSTPVMAQAPSPVPAKPSLLSRMKAVAHTGADAVKPAPKTAVPEAKTAVPAKSPSAAANGQGPRTEKSLACSKQADARNVHGKARKSFMSHCKKV